MDVGDSDRTWRDEMATEVLYAFLSKAVSAAAREEIDLPHVLICRDVETGAVSYSGPFPTGLAALAAAEREQQVDDATNDGPPMSFSVAALLPAVVPTTGNPHF